MRGREHSFVQFVRTLKRAVRHYSICHIDRRSIMFLIIPNVKQHTTYRVGEIKFLCLLFVLLSNRKEIARKLPGAQIRLVPALSFLQTTIEHLSIFDNRLARSSPFFLISVFHLLYIFLRHINHGFDNILNITQDDTVSLATFLLYVNRRTTLYGANLVSLERRE